VVTTLTFSAAPPNLQVCADDTGAWTAPAVRLPVAESPAKEPESARFEPFPERYVRDWDQLRLNVDQRAAVSRGLGSDVLFLWGPPGTGKTDVVAHIIEGCYRQGHNVLFLAPTHVAVDQGLHRVYRLLAGEAGFKEGLVQRTGQIALPALDAEYGDWIRKEAIVARLAAGLHREIEAVTGYQLKIRGRLARRMRVEGLMRQQADALRTLAADQGAWQAAGAAAHAAGQQHQVLTEEIRRLETATVLRRQHRRNQLAGQMAQMLVNYTNHAAAEAFRVRLAAAHQAAEHASRQLAQPDCDVSALPPLAALRQVDQDLTAKAEELRGRLRKLADQVRARCRVKGATVAKAVAAP
jgi:AAA domain